MCLTIQKHITKRLRSRKTPFVAWKRYKLDRRRLSSPFQFQCVDTPGNIVSGREDKNPSVLERVYGVNRGIHVFLSRNDCLETLWYGDVCVPVVCDPKDLVAGGTFDSYCESYKSAVFMKVRITKQAFTKATNSNTEG